MDLHKNPNTNWCQNNFDEDDINRPGPSGLKHNTGHFVVIYLNTYQKIIMPVVHICRDTMRAAERESEINALVLLCLVSAALASEAVLFCLCTSQRT